MFSSTNYVIAGLVLLGNAPEGQRTWQTYDIASALDMDKNDFTHSNFLPKGKMSENGLTVAGSSLNYGEVELFNQDASILGWTSGNLIASARDVAKFYWDLLSPYSDNKKVSVVSLNIMQDWVTLDRGVGAFTDQYGAGLMIQNFNEKYYPNYPPYQNLLATSIGHSGDTYGFTSNNGYYPQLNATISVIMNEDSDRRNKYLVTCQAVEIVAKSLGIDTEKEGLECSHATPPSYICITEFGKPFCTTSYHSHRATYTKAICDAKCGKSAVEYLM